MGKFAGCIWLAAALAAAAAPCLAQKSIHLQPVGTIVRSSFELMGKVVPLPGGDYFLAATHTHESTHVSGDWLRPKQVFINVYLAQVEAAKLRAAVVATAILDHGSTPTSWTDEPCKRDDTLHRLDLAQRSNQRDCLLVNHIVESMGAKSTGLFAKAAELLASRGVELPVPVLITAAITQVEAADRVSASYAFNPQLWGCDSPRAAWNASQWHKSRITSYEDKRRFVDSVVEWGKQAQAQLRATLTGRAPAVSEAARFVECKA